MHGFALTYMLPHKKKEVLAKISYKKAIGNVLNNLEKENEIKSYWSTLEGMSMRETIFLWAYNKVILAKDCKDGLDMESVP